MALTVEDGTIVDGANSYISAGEYQTWANARFGSERPAADASIDTVEAMILRATDYFETLDFVGEQLGDMAWPRSHTGFKSTLPQKVILAIYELTYAEEIGQGMNNSLARQVVSERVGPISRTYKNNARSRTHLTAVHNTLRPLLRGGSSQTGMQFNVCRG